MVGIAGRDVQRVGSSKKLEPPEPREPGPTNTSIYAEFCGIPVASNWRAYSGPIRARIPAGPGQGFRNDAGAYSESIWALIPA
jgi:hypothetical protein